MPAELTALQQRILNNTVLSETSSYNGTPCWEWIGKRSSTGKYGHMNLHMWGKHRTFSAHRVAAYAFKGDPLEDDGRVQMHLCNNSLCCAPLHLALGTQAANMQHCVASGRHASQQKGQADNAAHAD